MTTTQIARKQQEANLPYTLAAKIREMLDAARKDQGKGISVEDWEQLESEVSDLVFGE